MAKINRNDPCPCGSKKKYKKCCLLKDEQKAHQQETKEQSTRKAMDYINDKYPDIEPQILPHLVGPYYEEFAKKPDLFPPQFLSQFINEYMLIDFEDEELDITLLKKYIQNEEQNISVEELKYLVALVDTYKTLYEVVEIKNGQAVLLQDYFTKCRYWVQEKIGTYSFSKWEIIFARIEKVDQFYLLSGPIFSFPRDADCQLEELKSIYQHEKKIFKNKPEIWLFNFRHLITPLIFQQMLDYYLNFKLNISNKDGDVFNFCQAECEIIEYFEVKRYLAQNFELSSDEPQEKVYLWLDKNNSIIASFYLAKKKLTVETNSKERLSRIKKKYLAKLFSWTKNWQYKAEYLDTFLAKNQDQQQESEQDTIPPEVTDQLAKVFFADYYKKWLDLPIPILDNLTPRQASKKKSMKNKLIDLLKLMENRRAEGAQDDNQLNPAWIDMEKIKKELNIKY